MTAKGSVSQLVKQRLEVNIYSTLKAVATVDREVMQRSRRCGMHKARVEGTTAQHYCYELQTSHAMHCVMPGGTPLSPTHTSLIGYN